MKKFVRDLFCGPTNTHWELARVLTGVFAFGLLVGVIYNVAKGGGFHAVDYATAAGIILGAGGIGIAAKDVARPKALRSAEAVEG